MALEQVRRGLEPQRLAEIVLRVAVLHVSLGKNRAADQVFVEHGAAQMFHQCPAQGAFAGPRQAGHHDHHASKARALPSWMARACASGSPASWIFSAADSK